MPQVDLETLVCGVGGGGAGDGKVSCETLIPTLPDPDPDPNFPPESISIPIQDYSLDLSAAVTYDRDDSAKESTNPKSQAHNPNPNPNATRSSSQRYASANLKANGPILGLPNKIKHVTSTCNRPRPLQTSSRIFPKKKSGTKSAVPEYEPSSPKVSCFGKVLSDREREKCGLAHRQRSPDSSGCWAGFAALFSCGGSERDDVAVERFDDVARRDIPLKRRNIPLEEEADSGAAPGLGGMKRFASGRRAASWGGDVDVDVDVDVGRRSLDEGRGIGAH